MSVLAIVGFGMITIFMILLMTKRITAMNGLILIPIAVALALGFGPKVGAMALDGFKKVAPTAVMIAFAMVYFMIMIDTGLFDPLINAILKAAKGDPIRVIVGTALLAGLVSLDGDGATTYIVTTSAMLAVHRRIGIDPIILPTMAIMQDGVMNITPWGGPTGRVMAALQLDASQVFPQLIPGMIVATCWVLVYAYFLGRKERARLGVLSADKYEASPISAAYAVELEDGSGAAELKRPKLFWFNLLLTITLLGLLGADIIPLNVLFMTASALALVINYGGDVKLQAARISHYGGNVWSNISMVLSAGIFTGIMQQTKMIDAMAGTLVNNIPPAAGPYLALVTAFTSLPFDYFLTNDAYYFGIVPVLAKTAATYGITAAEIARASLVAQGCHLLSPLVASTYLLIGLNGVTLGELTKKALLPSIVSSIVMIVVALATGAFPIAR